MTVISVGLSIPERVRAYPHPGALARPRLRWVIIPLRILREAKAVDKSILQVCKNKRISEQTFHRWKREFGIMPLDQAKRLKELEKENARLKRMLADEILGKELIKEALEKKL